jgi:hypothetical protein
MSSDTREPERLAVIQTPHEGGNADPPSSSSASFFKMQRVLAPGDWVHIDYQGRTVVGMIDRLQEGLYTFAYWEGSVLRFGTAKPSQIGAWDEQLTTEFRAAIAIDPHYVTKFIASWKGPDRAEPRQLSRPPTQGEPRYVQKRLFRDD